jgi:glycosyltransferase involved in cell wall biosynthesis
MDFRTGKDFEGVPLVTIGVLSYNYSKYVIAALNSLLTQTYPNIELIIVDDNSTENTPEIIDGWIKDNGICCIYIKNESNTGITRVSNKLVTLAKGKYISLFAIDDIMLPRKIELQVKLLEEAGDEYGLCYANAETIDEDDNAMGLYKADENYNFREGFVLPYYIDASFRFATPTALIRVSAYQKTGLYDERVLIEDYNFFLRLFALYKIKYCDYPCLKYRVKKYSGIHSKMSENHSERYYRDRILSNDLGLKYVKDKQVKRFLIQKNTLYLKKLADYDSQYFPEMFRYLFARGYFGVILETTTFKLKKIARHIFFRKKQAL